MIIKLAFRTLIVAPVAGGLVGGTVVPVCLGAARFLEEPNAIHDPFAYLFPLLIGQTVGFPVGLLTGLIFGLIVMWPLRNESLQRILRVLGGWSLLLPLPFLLGGPLAIPFAFFGFWIGFCHLIFAPANGTVSPAEEIVSDEDQEDSEQGDAVSNKSI